MKIRNRIRRTSVVTALSGSLLLMPVVGCESLPGSDEQQGAVIGGVAGAATGAMVGGEDNRLIGALIGGALGAGGGYLVGANADKITGDDDEARDEAIEANEQAQRDPATAADVENATTADLNQDGFVTMDEVVAMEQAGLNDEDILNRLEATGQIFELTPQQQDFLRGRGVSQNVVTRMGNINQADRQELLRESGVIGQPSRNSGI